VPTGLKMSIFDPYDNASQQRGQSESMGVGLFVSRRLAHRMGGDITCRRSAGWTVFELSLPVIPQPVVGQVLSHAIAAG
jgi:signal transduction histidine kinase